MTQNEQSTKGGFSQFLFIFGGFWVVFSLIFVVVGLLIVRSETEQYTQLLQEGQATRAIITDLTVDNGEESTRYYVSYKYEVPVNDDPTPFRNIEGIPATLYHSLHIDQRIDIIYVANDPSIARLKSQFTQPNTTVGWFFSGFGGVFMTIGLVIVLVGLRIRLKK